MCHLRLPQPQGQPVPRGRLLRIPGVCEKDKVQLFSYIVKTIYLEVVKVQEWEIREMG